jgi:hypothetical protein
MKSKENPIKTYEFFANPNMEEIDIKITDETGIGKRNLPIKSNRAKRREEARKKKRK